MSFFRYMYCDFFSPSKWFFFSFSQYCLWISRIFWFWCHPVYRNFLCFFFFVCLLKEIFAYSVFYSRNFVILAFMFKLIIHLKFLCVFLFLWSESRFIFSLHVCLIGSAPLIENLSFPPLNCLGALVENQLSLYVWTYFWMLFSAINLFICSYINTTFSWLL